MTRVTKPIQLAVLVVSVLTPMIADTTSVVLIRSPNQLVLAADSLRTFEPVESGKERVFNACKIHVANNFAFSADGTTIASKFSLDAVRTTSEILAEGGTLDAKAHRIATKLKGPLLRTLVWSRSNMDPTRYAKNVLPMPANLSIVIAGVESGLLQFATIDFERRDDSKGTPVTINAVVDSCAKESCNNDGIQYRMFGFMNAAKARVDADKHFFTKDLVSDASRLIEIEIKDAPDAVGPPISIISIDVMGLHWLANSCRE